MIKTREEIQSILTGKDDRFLVVVGPCSTHDTAAGREYAQKLAALAKEVSDKMLVVMRVFRKATNHRWVERANHGPSPE